MVDNDFSPSDVRYMNRALELAEMARQQGEVPVGAVVVQHEHIIGEGFNQVITQSDPTAHAEVMALRAASQHLGNYRLPDCELFVTLEPCLMCLGAIFHGRLSRVVYGAADPKTGACHSVLEGAVHALNHHAMISGGLLANACGTLLSNFFSERRQLHKRLNNS